jgi:hypothetical protein
MILLRCSNIRCYLKVLASVPQTCQATPRLSPCRVSRCWPSAGIQSIYKVCGWVSQKRVSVSANGFRIYGTGVSLQAAKTLIEEFTPNRSALPNQSAL